jgi:hypothetical protein
MLALAKLEGMMMQCFDTGTINNFGAELASPQMEGIM